MKSSVNQKKFVLNKDQKLRYISNCLAWLSCQVKLRNSVCFYDINHVAEDVYSDLLNAILRLNFENQNDFEVNCESIDLVDLKNRTVAQVTSQRNKGKLVGSLTHLDAKKFCGYRYVFVSIVDDPPDWRRSDFKIPEGIRFDPSADVLGPQKLMRLCNGLQMDELEKVYQVCCIHFGNQDKAALLQMEDLKLFFIVFSEILAKESIILDYCNEYLDNRNPDEYLSRISSLSKNQLHHLLLRASDSFSELRYRLLPHHSLLDIVKKLESLHFDIDNSASQEPYIDIKKMKNLLLQERKLMTNALVLFADDLGVNREDILDEFYYAMNNS